MGPMAGGSVSAVGNDESGPAPRTVTRDDVDPTKRRYAVVGTGAIGGYYGARLAAAGHEVHFVARTDLDAMRRRGLRVESPGGDVLLPDVSVFATADEVPPVDVVLLTTKTSTDEPGTALVAPFTDEGATVVLMQNGLGIEERLAADLPGATVLGAMCFMCSNRVAPGHIRHLDFGSVTIGQHAPGASTGAGITPAVTAFADDLAGAGVTAHPIPDLVTGRWRKLVWNIAFNGLSVILDAGTDELMADPATRSLIVDLMREVVGAAAACGHPIPESFIDEMMTTTDAMTPYKTSMKLDAEAGRPLEIDTIYQAPVDQARAAGFTMSRAEAVLAQLRFLDDRNRARR
jgi:2-dehydropantoate 2-reductase